MSKETSNQNQPKDTKNVCCGDDKYRALFMASRDAVMTLEGPSWKFTSGNPATIEMFKAKDEAEFLSYEPWKLSPNLQPDGHSSDKKAKEMIEKAMHDGTNFFEWTHKRLNGEIFFAEVLLSKVAHDGKMFLHAVVRDITERKKMEKKSKEQEGEKEKERFRVIAQDLEKFKLAVENASDQIAITDKEGVVLYINKAVELITGYLAKEIIGQKAGKLWGGLMEKDFYTKMWKIIKEDKIFFKGEIKNKRKNGQIYYAEINISPILDKNDDVEFFVAIERDITQAKDIDRAKTEFVSIAAHQLRTPLSAINWSMELFIDEGVKSLTARQMKYLEYMNSNNRRMVNLVNALLNVSRLELGTFAVEPKLIELAEFVDVIIKDAKQETKRKKLQVKSFISGKSTVNVDLNILHIVIQNLISNAIKYTPDKGQITMDINNKDHELLIKIVDSGYGIPKDQQDKVFTKFFRAENIRTQNTDGTGLGLYVVKSMLEKIGGKIWFESEENKGTTFYVDIPLQETKSE